MEGAAQAAKSRLDLAFWQAWHTEAFAKMKPKDFKAALKNHFAEKKPASKHAQGIAYFHRLKARGLPVAISKNEIN
jgi:hypothetical protein